MHLLVFQHIEAEHPAAFAGHIVAAGDTFDVVRFHANDPIPDLDGYDALLVMGGPMDVWETKTFPWLVSEKEAIRRWVKGPPKPFLGICLGHQLLVDTLGGECAPMAVPELALTPVYQTKQDKHDRLFASLPESMNALHWHGVEAIKLPTGSTVLAQNGACNVQAIRVGRCAWGLQFHPEIVEGLITDWMKNEANQDCANNWLGSKIAAQELSREVEAFAPKAVVYSKAIYEAFRTAT
jgi:GMP synthase-like glutamine amidotransferase